MTVLSSETPAEPCEVAPLVSWVVTTFDAGLRAWAAAKS
jgi:hypothetical protein